MVGSCFLPTLRPSSNCEAAKARIRRAASRKAASSSANSSPRVAAGSGLGLERGKLLGAELLALCVGEQPVDAARDMAQVESDGGKPREARIQICVGKAPAPFPKVLFRQLKSVQDGPLHGRNIGQGAAEPGLGQRITVTHAPEISVSILFY